MRPLDAYHGNLYLFWPRLSLRGRHSRRGLTPYNPITHLGSSLPGAPASFSYDPSRSASVYDVLDRIAEERS